jgi:hypothetical protein
MGIVARFISGKSSGLGKVIMALCEGLTERGLEFHLTAPNQEFRRTHQDFPDTDILNK